MVTSSSVWFQGPVADAVSQVNAKGCVFAVFARDESAESDAMSAILSEENLVQRLSQHAVAIELIKDTDNAILFSHLYPVQSYPSLFLLKSGALLHTISGSATSEEIIRKFDQAVAHSPTQPPAAQPAARPAGPTQAPAPTPTPVHSSAATVPSPSVAVAASTSAQSPTESNAQDKKERLKKQLEEIRKKKMAEEAKNTREREVQRRRTGQEIQVAQESHADRQRQKYAEEVKKERKKEEEHRRKLREQIESDKRERAAQRQRDLDRQQNNATPSSTASTGSTTSKSTICNLNVRQLDGSQIRKQFNAIDTLDAVMKWIEEERTDGDAPYMLLAQFPARQFSIGDESRTLKELDLVPSSTLIMKPSRKVSSAYAPTGAGVWGYASSAVNMAYSVAGTSWTFVNNVLGTLLPASGGITGGTTLGAQTEFGNEEEEAVSASSDIRAAAAARSSRGKIHTLASIKDDGKDPNQTYNGNSVNQQ